MMLGEEGSGMGPPSKGTGAEDMESSGSGYGPDDEDAHVGGDKTKGKSGLDSEEDDDIDDDDEEDEDEDFENKKQRVDSPTTASTTTSTTSTTTTTTENYDEKSRILELVGSLHYILYYCLKRVGAYTPRYTLFMLRPIQTADLCAELWLCNNLWSCMLPLKRLLQHSSIISIDVQIT